MRRTRLLSIALAALLALSLAPVGADAEREPHVTDAIGDANFVNYQGFRGLAQDPDYDEIASADTRPANIDSADLVSIWLETDYDEVVEVDGEDGTVLAVRYEPTALRVSFETLAPASPTFGPTLVFRLPAMIGGCQAFIQAWVHGPGSSPTDTEGTDIRQLDEGCPGGVSTVSDGFELEFDDNVMSLVFPFDAPASASGLFTPTTLLQEDGDPHVRPLVVAATVPSIDEAHGFWSFRVGSDAPDDVDCTEDGTPDDERCSVAPE